MPVGTCTVVNYHGVLPHGYSIVDADLDGNLVSVENLREQLRLLKSCYDVIGPEDFRQWIERGVALPPRAILVTCDDGLVNTLTDMLPVLQDAGVPCLFFVTGASCGENPGPLWHEELYEMMRTGRIGEADWRLPGNSNLAPSGAGLQALWWDTVQRASRMDAEARAAWLAILRRKSEFQFGVAWERRWRLMNVDELKQMAAAGVSIGAHTLSHPVLAQCSEDEARREIVESKAAVERVLGTPVWAFAYSFGDSRTMGDREERLAREAGFTCAFLNVAGTTTRARAFALCRMHVTADMNLSEFEAHLSGVHARLQKSVRGWGSGASAW